jgi:cytochrome c2
MKVAKILALAGAPVLIYSATAFCQGDAPDRGREVYAVQKCALCHSIGGVGGKKMPLDRAGSKLKPEDMRKWIRAPKAVKSDSTMKAYPNLPEKDLNDLIEFLITLR